MHTTWLMMDSFEFGKWLESGARSYYTLILILLEHSSQETRAARCRKSSMWATLANTNLALVIIIVIVVVIIISMIIVVWHTCKRMRASYRKAKEGQRLQETPTLEDRKRSFVWAKPQNRQERRPKSLQFHRAMCSITIQAFNRICIQPIHAWQKSTSTTDRQG